MKGIILAGGSGTRLNPITMVTSKQLLPVYDKPMIYYPLATLLSAGVNEILIITTPRDINIFKSLLGNGEVFGVEFQYRVQEQPLGLAHAFIISEDFIGNDPVTMILGDNIFLGLEFGTYINSSSISGAHIFNSFVQEPQRYGVVELDKSGKIKQIIEKPNTPPSNYAVTGLYHYDNEVVEVAKSLGPSDRGELEITDLNNIYLQKLSLNGHFLEDDVAWFDTGTFSSLSDASKYVEAFQKRHGRLVGSPHISAINAGFISTDSLMQNIENNSSEYFLTLQKNVEQL